MLKIFNYTLYEKLKKGCSLITATTLAFGLSACTSGSEATKNQEESSTSIQQIESQVDSNIDVKNEPTEAEPKECWFDEDKYTYGNSDYVKVTDFDLMLTQSVNLPEQILNNDDFKNLKGKVKNYIDENNLYFNVWTPLYFDSVISLSVINDDTNDFNRILYIDYNNYFSEDHLYLSYTNWNDPLYAMVDTQYSYDFDKDGNTIRKYILNEYNDYNNKYEIEVENDIVKTQTITYQAETVPFKIELYNKDDDEKDYRLEITTGCGWNNITLTSEDYDILSTQMQKCTDKDELLSFVSNNQEILEKHLESIKPEYYDDGYRQAEWLIESYAEKGKTKVLVP